jgi:four helix bundle protein
VTKVKCYRELIVWQRSMDLAESIYSSTRSFPREEMFGITAQMRKAAVSVPSNIAEGQGRTSTADFLRHLSIAYGSLLELETQILLAARIFYLRESQTRSLMDPTAEVGKLLNGLMKSLNRSGRPLTTDH